MACNEEGGAPVGTPPFPSCVPASYERYFGFAQAQPPPHRHSALQAQRAPQLHGSTGVPAHPHEAA